MPATVDDVAEMWEVSDKNSIAPPWDFMWTFSAEEGREKQMAQQAFTVEDNEELMTVPYTEDYIHVADSALKVACVQYIIGRSRSLITIR